MFLNKSKTRKLDMYIACNGKNKETLPPWASFMLKMNTKNETFMQYA
jgi:hypothetical protein